MHNVVNLDFSCFEWETVFCLVQITVDQMKVFTVNWRLWEAGWTGRRTAKQSVRWIIKKQRRWAQTVQQNKDEWTPGSIPGVQSRGRQEKTWDKTTQLRGGNNKKWEHQREQECEKAGETEKKQSVGKQDGEQPRQRDCEKERIRIPKLFPPHLFSVPGLMKRADSAANGQQPHRCWWHLEQKWLQSLRSDSFQKH